MTAANPRIVSAIGDLVAAALPAIPPVRPDKLRGPAPSAWGQPVLQMLTPMVRWDWPVAINGAMSYQQWTFADSVPASLTPSSAFFATGSSFSQGYLNFLGVLDPSGFALRNELARILDACKPPSSQAQEAPDGWARAPDAAGINRWRLAYGVGSTPDAWVAANTSGQGDSMRLSLPVTSETTLGLTDAAGASHALPLQGKASEVVISASAWGQVRINPGSWYDGSMVKFARNGPFVHGVAPDQAFSSMLSGRVSAIIVAYNPSMSLSLPAAEAGGALESARTVEIGGFRFQQGVAGAPPAAGADTIAYVAAAVAGPWIIGAMIEPFT